MARVTVEDCVVKVPNRFELVMLASQRSKDLSAGAPLTIERDRDKNPVIALREIAEGTASVEKLENALISGMQTVVKPVENEADIKVAEAELAELRADTSATADEEVHLVGSGAFEITEEV